MSQATGNGPAADRSPCAKGTDARRLHFAARNGTLLSNARNAVAGNVAYQAKTSQVDDYFTVAEQKDINFNLYVRGSGASVPTTLSAQLQQQIDDGNMNLFYIPGTE